MNWNIHNYVVNHVERKLIFSVNTSASEIPAGGWQSRKIQSSPPPTDTQKLQLHREQLSLRRTWKPAKKKNPSSSSTTKDIKSKTTLRQVRRGETESSYSWRDDLQTGGDITSTEVLPKEQGFAPHIRHPSPEDLPWEDEPP